MTWMCIMSISSLVSFLFIAFCSLFFLIPIIEIIAITCYVIGRAVLGFLLGIIAIPFYIAIDLFHSLCRYKHRYTNTRKC